MITDDEGNTMITQIGTGAYDGIPESDETRGSLSASLVGSSDAGTPADLVEIRLSTNGASHTLRLTKTEADVFSLLLARLADDPDAGSEDSATAVRLTDERRSITRDQLIKLLLGLPRKSEIDVQIGTEHVGISGVVPWGRDTWASLQCHHPDFLDLLEAWRLPADVHEQILNGTR